VTLRHLRLRLRAVFRRAVVERELSEEIRFHLEQEAEKNRRQGMDEGEARRRALAAFGGVERTKEDYRDGRGDRALTDWRGDFRQAARLFRRNPTLAGAIVLTLALAIGANVAIFSAVNAALLRPLPFHRPERLAMLWEDNHERGWVQQSVAPANMLDWAEQVRSFAGVAAYSDFAEQSAIETPSGPRPLRSIAVTGGFFDVLGVRPVRGRGFGAADTWASGERIAVMSDAAWRQHLGADSTIIGTTVSIDGRPVRIVGVMPPRFAFPDASVELWVPTAWEPGERGQTYFRRAHWLRPFARLRDGATFAEARAELTAVMSRLERDFPGTNRNMRAGMEPLHDFRTGTTRRPLLVLLGATGVLLLIACANVGNLLLVRAAAREREVVLRRALGAGRARVARQTMVESLVLAGAGGALGLLLGWWGTHALGALQPAGLLPARDISPDLRVGSFVLAVTTLSALAFGVAPALWSARRNAADVLKDASRTSSGSRRVRRWGSLLAISEVALAVVLTVGAGLLLRSFWHLTQVKPGFEPRGVLVVTLAFPEARYAEGEDVQVFQDRLRERLHDTPGVESAALATQVPLASYSAWTSDFAVRGQPVPEQSREIGHRDLSPGYFQTMRVPLVAGRDFTLEDRRGGERVAIINETMRDRHFATLDPVGQLIAFTRTPDSSATWYRIVGIAGSEYQKSLGDSPQPEVFTALSQIPRYGVRLVVRSTGDPALLVPTIERLVTDLDPAMPLLATTTLEDARSGSLARERFLAILLLAFAVVGALLAIVGVYGVVAQLALRRTNEMGIRMALGAQAAHVRWLIVRHGLTVVGVGVLAGSMIALAISGVMRTLLFHVGPVDLVTFSVVPLGLLLTGVMASWLPAARATRADPTIALRSD
jgi:putative ABC transport system permease protein